MNQITTTVTDLEVIQLTTENGRLMALISYRNPHVVDLNYGFGIVKIPVNIRELQKSMRNNILVNQSLQKEAVAQINH